LHKYENLDLYEFESTYPKSLWWFKFYSHTEALCKIWTNLVQQNYLSAPLWQSGGNRISFNEVPCTSCNNSDDLFFGLFCASFVVHHLSLFLRSCLLIFISWHHRNHFKEQVQKIRHAGYNLLKFQNLVPYYVPH